MMLQAQAEAAEEPVNQQQAEAGYMPSDSVELRRRRTKRMMRCIVLGQWGWKLIRYNAKGSWRRRTMRQLISIQSTRRKMGRSVSIQAEAAAADVKEGEESALQSDEAETEEKEDAPSISIDPVDEKEDASPISVDSVDEAAALLPTYNPIPDPEKLKEDKETEKLVEEQYVPMMEGILVSGGLGVYGLYDPLEYLRQVLDSKGFEVDLYKRSLDDTVPPDVIQPLPLYFLHQEDVDALLKLAVNHYNHHNQGSCIRDPILVKANECNSWYFITFAATDDTGSCNLYRSRLFRRKNPSPPSVESLVHFCFFFKKCDPPYRPWRDLDIDDLITRYNSIVKGTSCQPAPTHITDEWGEYIRQVVDSEGFDVDYFPTRNRIIIQPDSSYLCSRRSVFDALVDLAIKHYNNIEGGVKISNSEPHKILKVTCIYFFIYFITFEAKDDAGERNIYRARVLECPGAAEKSKVAFCTLFKRAAE